MNILALDLGKKTGMAFNDGETMLAQTITLCTENEMKLARRERLDRRCDPRVVALFRFLWRYRDRVTHVVFEDVEFCKTSLQCQLWASFRAAVWLSFADVARIECLNVKTLKKYATGSGDAEKSDMEAAFRKRLANKWPRKSYDDNAIDAIWLHDWMTSRFHC